MRVIHRIGINPDFNQRLVFMSLGIELPFSNNNLTEAVTLELDEESDDYKKLQPYLQSWEAMDATATLFDAAEITNAPFLAMKDVWSNGYPMLDSNFGYMTSTYDNKDFCKECGIGLVQKEPFRIKKEPNWGNKNMFTLNWVYDELFVTSELYNSVFKKHGIKTMPVLLYKKDTVIDNVVQLQIPDTDSKLELEGRSYKDCPVCKRKRYDLINKGFFPSFKKVADEINVMKTGEFFGTGKNARKYIVFTSDIYQELHNLKVKCNYIPMKS